MYIRVCVICNVCTIHTIHMYHNMASEEAEEEKEKKARAQTTAIHSFGPSRRERYMYVLYHGFSMYCTICRYRGGPGFTITLLSGRRRGE